MRWALFPLQYIRWHYTVAYKDMLRISSNYLWFFWHFFSIPVLFRTLFSPWRRIGVEEGTRGLEYFFSKILIDFLMRLIGLVIRIITIVVGMIVLVLILGASIVGYVIWTVLPLLLVFLLITSLRLLL